jgi:Fe-S-cluster containining protein
MTFDETVSRLSGTDQKIIRDMMVLLEGIDRRTKEFSSSTGLKCRDGCGACCENPQVETTLAEVLPLAASLWAGGTAENKLEDIRARDSKGVCVFYNPDPVHPGRGRCGIYAFRPGLCRLFGFSARKNKKGQPELLTCKIIKSSQPEDCRQTQESLQKGDLEAPVMTHHAMAVANIDPVHGQKCFPINEAVRLAIEKIGYKTSGIK